jgi:putative glutathione S-transferase
MGLLQEGQWVDQWYETKSADGKFLREDSQFRYWITPEGSGNLSQSDSFPAATDRYHLYISHACPWAHRAVIFRALKGLEKIISMSIVHWHMGEQGWTFQHDKYAHGDQVNNAKFLHQIYTKADPNYSGRVTVPVLWDKEKSTIVSNESSEIIRMMNSSFDHLGASPGDFYPEEKQKEIDSLNDRIYTAVNNGVYKAGFATSQEAYEQAVTSLFETLDWLEEKLHGQKYLTGSELVESDWRLFTTLIRFDAVYVGHFKCNIRRIADYTNLSKYLNDLLKHPGVSKTIQMDHIKNHYYGSHSSINPSGVVPIGPALDF